jgi:hypothetical protein
MTVRPLCNLTDLAEERRDATQRLDRSINAEPVSPEAGVRRQDGIQRERRYLSRLDEQIASMHEGHRGRRPDAMPARKGALSSDRG